MSWGWREAKSGKEGDENKEEEMRQSGWRERGMRGGWRKTKKEEIGRTNE